ncbi:hypothetical protein OfM1_18830 [Lactovum odontotermitis]
MLKTVTVGNREIKLQSSGATPIYYSNEFKRDFFKDFGVVIKFAMDAQGLEDITAAISLFDSGAILRFMDFAYIYAKNADHSIPDEETWLDEFETFPILDILEPMVELMMASLTVKKPFAADSKRTKPSTAKVSSTSRKKRV